jgi:hypothetical protein
VRKVGRQRRLSNEIRAGQSFVPGALVVTLGVQGLLGDNALPGPASLFVVALGIALLAQGGWILRGNRKIPGEDTLVIDTAGVHMTGPSPWSYTWAAITEVNFSVVGGPPMVDQVLTVLGTGAPAQPGLGDGELATVDLGWSWLGLGRTMGQVVRRFAPEKFTSGLRRLGTLSKSGPVARK